MKNKFKRIACLAAAAMLVGAFSTAANCFAADGGDDAEIFTYMDFIDEKGEPIGKDCADVWGTYASDGTKTFAAETGNTDFEEKAVKFDVARADKNGKIALNSGQSIDPIAKNDLENARVRMRILVDRANRAANLPNKIEADISGDSGSSTISEAVPRSEIPLGEWHDMEIVLNPDADSLDDMMSIDRIALKLPNQLSVSMYSVYISKLQIVYEHKSYIETNISTDEDAIVISWNTNIEDGLYKVFCNGAEIGETADTFFRYIPRDYGTNFKFTVEGYDASGELLTTSAEKSIFLYSPDREVAFNILGEDGKYTSEIKPHNTQGQSPTGIVDEGVWWVYADGTTEIGNSPTGGSSMRYVVDKSKSQPGGKFQLRVGFKENKDFSVWDNGYFEFLIYPESEFEDDFNWNIMFHGNNVAMNKSISGLNVGEWNYIRLPLNDFSGIESVKQIGAERIQINFPTNLKAEPMSFKIANMCITVPRKTTTASIVGNGIDGTGRTYTDVSFTRAMDAATVMPYSFKIDGFNATEVSKASDTDYRIYFDKAFEFPMNYTLEIAADGIRDAEQRRLDDQTLSFTTSTFCPDVVVNDASVDKTDIANGNVKCSASLTAIFKGDRAAVRGKVLIAAAKNDRVIATAESEPFEAAVGGSIRLNAELRAEELKNAADCQISLYFISDDGNERPLCAYENK